MNAVRVRCVLALLVLSFASPLAADSRSKAATEAAEYVLEKFGKQAVKETAESFASRIESVAVKHGDDIFKAVREVGPTALQIAADAGSNEEQAIKLMARYGERGAQIVTKPRSMAVFLKFGDEAAAVMAKHPGVTESLIESQGEAAVRAFSQLDGQNARRLAMMADEGSLKALGRTDAVLDRIGTYGDRALDFIWKHKGPLTVGTALIDFLRDPKPFIDGAIELTATGAEVIVKPVAEIPKEIAKSINWTLIALCLIVLVSSFLVLRSYWRYKQLQCQSASKSSPRD